MIAELKKAQKNTNTNTILIQDQYVVLTV